MSNSPSPDDLKKITSALLEGLATVESSGAGPVAIGGDVTDSPITTNVSIGDQRIELNGEALAELTRQIQQQLLPHRLCDLPDPRSGFHGREEKVQALVQALQEGSCSQAVTALRGIGGIGKTELASQIAWQIIPFYPQAQILIDLQGTAPEPRIPTGIMEDIIRRFAPEASLPDDTVAIGTIYRQLLRDRKCLLILDNAADASQLNALLPPHPSAAIITSRRLIDLPGVPVHKLDNLARKDAISVLLSLLPSRLGHDEAGLEDLAEACANHPLALTVAGSFLNNRPHIGLVDYAARITQKREELRLEGLPEYDVMASLELSLTQLQSEDRELAERWRDLSVFPGDFDVSAASAVMGLAANGNEDTAGAGQILERLNDLSFIEIEQRGTTRYRLHDLMRDLAIMGQPDLRFAKLELRHARHFCDLLEFANDCYLSGDRERMTSGLRLLDTEMLNILKGADWASQNAGLSNDAATLASSYTDAGDHVLNLKLHGRDWIDWLKTAISTTIEPGDRRGEGSRHSALSNALFTLVEMQEEIGHHEEALTIAREIGDRRGEENRLNNLGNAYFRLGELSKAIGYYEEALTIARETGDRRNEGSDLGNLGNAYAALGDPRKAIGYYEEALTISREIGDRRGEGNHLGNLGNAYAAFGEPRKDIRYHEESLKISREIGDRRGEGIRLGNLGNAHAALGETDKAIEYLESALSIFEQTESPNAEFIRQRIKDLDNPDQSEPEE